MLKLIIVPAALLLSAQVACGVPLKFEEASLACHRLPIHVRPTKYELSLKFASLDSAHYEGQVDIGVEYVSSKARAVKEWRLDEGACARDYEPNQIVMHADRSVEIEDIEVLSGPYLPFISGPGLKRREIARLVRDEQRQMIAIKVKRGIYPTRQGTPGRISIKFKGLMKENKRGIYVSTYNDSEQIFKHIVSQFQPTDARTVFPSFDEPRFKVPFSVRVTHPKELTAYGNTEVKQVSNEGALASTTFVTTPSMPIHMLAFTIGQFDEPLQVMSERELSDGSKGKSRKIRVITAPGKRDTGEFALTVAKDALTWFENYIDFDFPLDKLDVIAIADHDKDNTESWGLVFVRDTLVWIDDETKLDTRITTAVNVAHVVVHQWFGNLISVGWWSDLWITEGVAAQFAFNMVQELYNFQSEYFVRLATLSGVMQADQPGKLHALAPPEESLQSGEQIYGLFDNLEFMKSGSMAQMIKETVGSHEYQRILRYLVKERAYKTVDVAHYQEAIMDKGDGKRIRDVDSLMEIIKTFPAFTGVPIVNCHVGTTSNGKQIRLDLESFNEAREHIVLPHQHQRQSVTIKVDLMLESGDKTLRPAVGEILRSAGHYGVNLRDLPANFDVGPDAKGNNFIKVDREPSIATYYRTRYSKDLYTQLEKVIAMKLLSPMDRLQILDDANNLVQANLLSKKQFKSLLDSYANEDYPAVVMAIMTATKTYKSLVPDHSSSLPTDKAIWKLFEKHGFDAPKDQELILQRARTNALTALIKQGNEEVTKAAVEAFDKAAGNLAPFLREPVYTAVVSSGNERVEQLLSHLSETKSYEEKVRLATVLTQSKDQEVLTKTKSWLESSGLKAETIKPLLDTIAKSLSQ